MPYRLRNGGVLYTHATLRRLCKSMTSGSSHIALRAVDRAVQRAHWLAELATALDQASKLTIELCDYCSEGQEAGGLRGRIRDLRREVDLMQKGRRPDAEEIRPHWT